MFYIAKYSKLANLKLMITDQMNIKDILEWYLLAGVDETCGNDVLNLLAKDNKATISAVSVRPAISKLAQNTGGAYKTAVDTCDKVSSLEELKSALEAFDGCALKQTASHTVFGDGNPQANLMLIGEAPGADEDREGLPFVGRSGLLLDKMMSAIGLSRKDYYICNILPWRPPGNRTPLDSEIAVCLPFLRKQIDLIDPDYILVLGGSAANSLLNMGDTISKMRGHWFDYPKANGKNAKVLASFHPAYLLRTAGQKAKAWSDLLKIAKALNDEKNC